MENKDYSEAIGTATNEEKMENRLSQAGRYLELKTQGVSLALSAIVDNTNTAYTHNSQQCDLLTVSLL